MSQRTNIQTSEYLQTSLYQINTNQHPSLPRHCRVQESYGRYTETVRQFKDKDMTN